VTATANIAGGLSKAEYTELTSTTPTDVFTAPSNGCVVIAVNVVNEFAGAVTLLVDHYRAIEGNYRRFWRESMDTNETYNKDDFPIYMRNGDKIRVVANSSVTVGIAYVTTHGEKQ
jgi:hypothetical protein